MNTLSVVLPAYNEESGIADIIRRILAIQSDLAKVGIMLLELLVVDDGSRDQTTQITSKIADEYECVRLIRHVRNRGYGAALKTGFSKAQGDFIAFLDADGTYPPEYFPQLCEAIINGSDLVIGSRMAGSESKMPLMRRIGNLFFANLLTLLAGQVVSDSASGMRVFRRQILEQIYPLPDGLNLTPVMSTRAIHEGLKMSEVPIPYSERVGPSKLSVLRDGKVFLQSMLWTVMTYNPVRILGILGLVGIGLAILVVLGLVFARIRGITSLGPWEVFFVYTALVAGVTGISIFSLGATFNYLVSLFYKRPIRQGLFGKPIFRQPLESYFGWIGGSGFIVGLIMTGISITLGLRGWEITRLWLYLLGSSMLSLIGIQLIIYWILMRILEELNIRELLVEKDLSSI